MFLCTVFSELCSFAFASFCKVFACFNVILITLVVSDSCIVHVRDCEYNDVNLIKTICLFV